MQPLNRNSEPNIDFATTKTILNIRIKYCKFSLQILQQPLAGKNVEIHFAYGYQLHKTQFR